MNEQPGDKRDPSRDPQKDRYGISIQLMRKLPLSSSYHFGAPYKNVGDKASKWKPQKMEWSPRYFPKSPRCWTTHLVKKPTCIIKPHQKAGTMYWRRRRITTNPEKECTGKRNVSNADHLLGILTGDNRWNVYMSLDGPYKRFIKYFFCVQFSINYKTSIPRVTI